MVGFRSAIMAGMVRNQAHFQALQRGKVLSRQNVNSIERVQLERAGAVTRSGGLRAPPFRGVEPGLRGT